MKPTTHDPGFYSESSDEEEENGSNRTPPGEFPEEEEGSQVVYEEVPWLENKPIFYPGLSNPVGDYIGLTEVIMEDYDDSDYEEEPVVLIEEEQKKYWKCSQCNELVEMELDVCWNCQSPMPTAVIHPSKEEVIKEVSENTPRVRTAGIGLASIISGTIIFFYERYSFRDVEWDNHVRHVLGSAFILLGIFFIIFKFNKDAPKIK